MAKKLVFFICLLVLSGCSSQELSGTIGSPSPFKTDGDNVVLRDSTKIVGSTTTNATFGTASSTNLCLIGDSCITTWPTSILTDLDLTSGFVITGDAGNKASATPAIFIDGYQIGISTTTPDYTLDIYGDMRATNIYGNIPDYVPYTGATADLNMANFDLITDVMRTTGNDLILQSPIGNSFILRGGTGIDLILDTSLLTTADKTFTFPDISGTFITTGNLTDITSVGTLSNLTVSGGVTSTNAYFTNLTVLGSLIGTLTGNADTATALAANPTDCGAGEFANAIAASGNLTCAVPAGGSSLWTQSNNNIYYNLGRVGIGTSSPEAILSISSSTQSAIPLVQVASTTGAMLFTIKSNGTIGIATSTPNPAYVLDIYGKTRTTNLELGNTTNAFQNGIIYKDGTPFIHNFNYGWNGAVTTNGGNIFIGGDTGNMTMGLTATDAKHSSNNIGIGNAATMNSMTTGYNNIAIGEAAMQGATTAYGNVAVGGMRYISGGSRNVSIGQSAGNAMANASNNTAIGFYALGGTLGQPGDYNVAIGAYTLWHTTGANNMALGTSALRNLTTGYQNSGIGSGALWDITTGIRNTGIGYYAGRYLADGSTPNTLGNYGILIGYDTRALADGDTNEIVIGSNAIGAGSNSVTLGSTTIQTTYLRGNVAIGTSTAVGLLDIYALGTSTLMIDSSTKGGCLCLADDDGVGYTCVGGNDGTVYWYSSGIGCH